MHFFLFRNQLLKALLSLVALGHVAAWAAEADTEELADVTAIDRPDEFRINDWLDRSVNELDATLAGEEFNPQSDKARIELDLSLDATVYEQTQDFTFNRSVHVSLPATRRKGKRLLERLQPKFNRASRGGGPNASASDAEASSKAEPGRNAHTVKYKTKVGSQSSGGGASVYVAFERRSERRLQQLEFHSQSQVGYDSKQKGFINHNLIVDSPNAGRFSPRMTTAARWQDDGQAALGTSMRFFRDIEAGRWDAYVWSQNFELAPEPGLRQTQLYYQTQWPLGERGWYTRLGGGVAFDVANDFDPKAFTTLSLGLRLDSARRNSIWDKVK